MYQFIESICYDEGKFQRLKLHNERFNLTRYHFFGTVRDIQLESFLEIPKQLRENTVKCRIVYGAEIESISYHIYEIKPVRSLQFVIDDTIDYAFKYADRNYLDLLLKNRGQSDDILIVKNGLITDSSYANIVFLQNNRWYSPLNPLLKGTRIKDYMSKGHVTPALLRPEDLHRFSEARLINSMISIKKSPVILIENIKY